MTKARAIKLIEKAYRRTVKEMSYTTGKYGRGMATEGYVGGYSQALADVVLLLHSGCLPDTRGFWEEEK